MSNCALPIAAIITISAYIAVGNNVATADPASATSPDDGCKRVYPYTAEYLICAKTAADAGNVKDNLLLASLYQDHLTTAAMLSAAQLPAYKFGKADDDVSIQYYSVAAKGGDTFAMRELARLDFINGIRVVPTPESERRKIEGIEWLKKAEAGGSWFAVQNLCSYYDLVKDYASQMQYCMKVVNRLTARGPAPGELNGFVASSIARHRSDAELKISDLYALGLGVSQDDRQALIWKRRAASDGSQQATSDIQKLDAENTAKQRQQMETRQAEAQQRLNEVAYKASLLMHKRVGDYVCSESVGGYVERVADDRVQIRVHHHYPFATRNDYDEFVWAKYNQVGTVCNN